MVRTTTAPGGKKSLGKLLAQAEAPAAPPAPLEPWEQVHQELVTALGDIKRRFVDAVRLAVRAIDEKVYERRGFADAADYFDNDVKFSYRTIMRYVQIWRATRALPEGEQDRALEELAKVGVHKAAIIAPAITREPQNWQTWVKDADQLKQPALQDKVSSAYGLKRTRDSAPTGSGSRFLDYILAHMPPDRKEPTKILFMRLMGGTQAIDDTSAIAAFLVMCGAMVRDFADQGVLLEWPE